MGKRYSRLRGIIVTQTLSKVTEEITCKSSERPPTGYWNKQTDSAGVLPLSHCFLSQLDCTENKCATGRSFVSVCGTSRCVILCVIAVQNQTLLSACSAGVSVCVFPPCLPREGPGDDSWSRLLIHFRGLGLWGRKKRGEGGRC